jgi:hypothetical protein
LSFKECKECQFDDEKKKCEFDKQEDVNMEIGEIGKLDDKSCDKECKDFKPKKKLDK